MSRGRFGGFRVGRKRYIDDWNTLKSENVTAPETIQDLDYSKAKGIWNLKSTMQFPKIQAGTSFRYVRWSVTATKTAGNLMQASEFVLQNNGADISMTGTTVTGPTNQTNEGPDKLVDNNTGTKFCSTATSGPWTFVFDLGSAKVFNGYRWATANDAEGRDPATWTVATSNDNTNWTTRSTVTGFSATSSRITYVGPWSF